MLGSYHPLLGLWALVISFLGVGAAMLQVLGPSPRAMVASAVSAAPLTGPVEVVPDAARPSGPIPLATVGIPTAMAVVPQQPAASPASVPAAAPGPAVAGPAALAGPVEDAADAATPAARRTAAVRRSGLDPAARIRSRGSAGIAERDSFAAGRYVPTALTPAVQSYIGTYTIGPDGSRRFSSDP